MRLKWGWLLTTCLLCLTHDASTGKLSELRTRQLLTNIRSHLAQQVEEVVQQKECDSGLTLCEPKKDKEEESPEASDEDIPPPPKIRGAHKPVVKVNPKEVIQTMIHKTHRVHQKEKEHDFKIQKLKVSVEDDDDDDDDKSKEVKTVGKKTKSIDTKKDDAPEKNEAKKEKTRKKEEKEDKDDEEEGIRFPGDLPVFAPTSSVVENELCRKHSRLYERQLQRYKMWALMMYDASAKLPSGILQGNTNQLGDFDECLMVNAVLKDKRKGAEGGGIQGKYCLAAIDLEASGSEGALVQAVAKAQANVFVKSSAEDPGYFIPRFTTINWGVCVPSSCTPKDVEKALAEELSIYNETAGVAISVRVDEDSCVDKEDTQFDVSFGGALVMILYLAVISAAGYGTYRDMAPMKEENDEKTEEKEKEENDGASEEKEEPVEPKEEKEDESKEDRDAKDETMKDGPTEEEETEGGEQKQGKLDRLLMAFSLKRTLSVLLSNSSSDSEITCIHGIKAICTLLLYVAHKVIPVAFTPYHNRIQFTKVTNSVASTFLRTSIIYTDSFLLVSGVLTSYGAAREVLDKGQVGWFRRIVTRIVRLSPPLLAVVLFYAYISEQIGSGPLWAPIVSKNAQVCRDNGWTNLLYIQNFFDFQEMCAPQTHQLALDMQLSAVAPVLVFILYKYDLLGILILQAVYLLSAALRYITTSNNELTLVFYHGAPVSQLYETANLVYTQTIYRATPYVLGVTLGFYLEKRGAEFKERLKRPIAAILWAVAVCLMLLVLLTPAHLASASYVYDVQEAAQYAALAPIAWSLALAWVIAACHLEYGGRLNTLLSCWPLQVLSRISYSVYLIQFLVFNHNVGQIRTPRTFSFFEALDFTEMCTTLALASLLTLLFDIPMKQVKSIVIECIPERSAPDPTEEQGQGQDGTDEETKANGPETEDDLVQQKTVEDEETDPEVRYPPDYEDEDEELNLRRSSRVRFDEGDDQEFWEREDGEELGEEEEEEEIGEAQEDGEDFWKNDDD